MVGALASADARFGSEPELCEAGVRLEGLAQGSGTQTADCSAYITQMMKSYYQHLHQWGTVKSRNVRYCKDFNFTGKHF